MRHYRLRTVAKRRKVFSFCLFTYRVVSAGRGDARDTHNVDTFWSLVRCKGKLADKN